MTKIGSNNVLTSDLQDLLKIFAFIGWQLNLHRKHQNWRLRCAATCHQHVLEHVHVQTIWAFATSTVVNYFHALATNTVIYALATNTVIWALTTKPAICLRGCFPVSMFVLPVVLMLCHTISTIQFCRSLGTDANITEPTPSAEPTVAVQSVEFTATIIEMVEGYMFCWMMFPMMFINVLMYIQNLVLADVQEVLKMLQLLGTRKIFLVST